MRKEEVVVRLKDIVPKYSDIFDKVILFGSVARNENTSKSDLDLYIELVPSQYLVWERVNNMRHFWLNCMIQLLLRSMIF